MATRTPVTLLLKTLTATASDSSYTVPNSSTLTISAATLNNTTGAPVTATIQVTPSGGSALPIVSSLPIAAAGAAPTTIPGLVGQNMAAGAKIEASGLALNVWISGYLQT